MLEKYSLLLRDFFSIAEPVVNSDILDQLKHNYEHNIDSKRKLSRVKDLKTLIRLLEKRDVISCDNIQELWCISKIFINKPELETKLLNYENWLKTIPSLSSYNMYETDEISISSQKQENTKKNLASVSESACNATYNSSESLIQSSISSVNNITQTYCYSTQGSKSSFDETRRLLQQTVLLQVKDRLGRSWRDVARHLGITEGEIDAVQLKYPYDLKEQSYQILNIYMSQTNTEQWAIKLQHALEKGRRRDLRELVEELIYKSENI